ncbi:hypothetical protein LR48_Vigan10g207900 [Vigna angularis]|uniref:Uncharacterized protein n=1 Tax=Phaseolus angularis TaxID=3914 RepID=A0A0L9VMR2_PHAAN|nr:hypothetical protein LR48_Vigan10g207900 [Vigna angularis]
MDKVVERPLYQTPNTTSRTFYRSAFTSTSTRFASSKFSSSSASSSSALPSAHIHTDDHCKDKDGRTKTRQHKEIHRAFAHPGDVVTGIPSTAATRVLSSIGKPSNTERSVLNKNEDEHYGRDQKDARSRSEYERQSYDRI